MKKENKELLIKYIICSGVACLITFFVFLIKGFFTHGPAENMQIVADGFFVSGLLMTLFAGLMYVTGEGALIGIGFVLRNVVLAFIPMGRAKHELYADYRERKIKEIKKSNNLPILFTGLLFLTVGIILTIIWYTKFYNTIG